MSLNMQLTKSQINIQTLNTWNPFFAIETFNSIHEIDSVWDEVLHNNNTLLSSSYLKAVEDFPPIGMKFRYVILRDEYKNPFGVVYFQIQFFNAGQSLSDKESTKSPCFFNTFQKYLKGLVAKQVEFNTFVCGNLLLTGENGFFFKPGSIPSENALQIISETAEKVQLSLNQSGIQCNVCLMKDFILKNQNDENNSLIKKQYHEFSIQPCMIMDLNPEWATFDDYLNSLHSKYRIRAKRAFKKSSGLAKKELSLDEIHKLQNEIHQIYLGVAENAGFNTVNLHVGYFYGLKKYMGENFRLFAYFKDQTLVGFYTMIGNGAEAEAHFLGYNKEENLHSQLYLNTLFDIIKQGIESKFSKINFSRTALEIKSSVGAVPQEMCCYMKHRSNFSNKFIRPILDYLNPEIEWVPRHPFK